jgi:hypothetical protein
VFGSGRAIELREISVVTIESGKPGRLRLGELDLRVQDIQLHTRLPHPESGARETKRFPRLIDVFRLAEIEFPVLLQLE